MQNLQKEDQIGKIKESFVADIIAVNEDSTVNIATMENVFFVMKDEK